MSTDAAEVFPRRLREVREHRELTQGELATRARLQPSAISHFETGTRKPSFDNLRRLADALDVTIDFLLGRVNDFKEFVGTDTLHRHYNELTSSDRDIAEQMMALLANKAKTKREDSQ